MNEQNFIFRNIGYCPICQEETVFVATNAWFRDYYFCLRCKSIPRERALMRVISNFFPQWQEGIIHESSPERRGASLRLEQGCKKYIPSQFFPDVQVGKKKGSIFCENLENMSFNDNSIDLHITQDVLEHVFSPEKAFKEIARTLKPGGAHIFTVPIINNYMPTECRAKQDESGTITYLAEASYHGNPIDNSGSLVTFDWGYDIVEKIWLSSNLPTYIIQIDDISNGIRAEFIDVFVTRKPKNPM